MLMFSTILKIVNWKIRDSSLIDRPILHILLKKMVLSYNWLCDSIPLKTLFFLPKLEITWCHFEIICGRPIRVGDFFSGCHIDQRAGTENLVTISLHCDFGRYRGRTRGVRANKAPPVSCGPVRHWLGRGRENPPPVKYLEGLNNGDAKRHRFLHTAVTSIGQILWNFEGIGWDIFELCGRHFCQFLSKDEISVTRWFLSKDADCLKVRKNQDSNQIANNKRQNMLMRILQNCYLGFSKFWILHICK